MVELIPAVCPKCGADLELPDDLKIGHCMYCGAKVIIEEKKPDIHLHGIGTLENYLELGKMMHEQGNYEKAIEYFNKALEINAKSIVAWNNKGLTYERVGADKEAFLCYTRVLEINPKHEKIRERIEKIRKRWEATYKNTLKEAEYTLEKFLSELKQLEQVKMFFYLGSFLIVILFIIFSSLLFGVFFGFICTMAFLPLVLYLVYLFFNYMWPGSYKWFLTSFFEEINSTQEKISEIRAIIDDLKKHSPDKEGFIDFYFRNW